MKIYNYNKETKEFTTSTNATANPLEKGKYLIPANATTKEPISSKDGFAVCFNEDLNEWEHIEDNRGKAAYDTTTKQEIKISYLGSLKEGFTFLVPSEFDKWNYKTNSWVCNEVEKEKSRVQNINSYTQSFITTKYPLEKQSSANLGIYGDEYKNEMISFISNYITLSNESIEDGTGFEDYKVKVAEIKAISQ